MDEKLASPEISVIIPTYNRAEDLRRCLNSLVVQTFKNFEVLVCDDGSTDNSAEVAAEFADRLDLRYETAENFGGPARPRNRGIACARAPYVAFLDCDDWWDMHKLELCCSHFKSDIDVIYHQMKMVKQSDPSIVTGVVKSWQVRPPVVTDLLVRGNALATSSVMVRTEIARIVGGFDENPLMIACEDYNFWLRIARFTDRFQYIDKPLGYYLSSDSGISSRDMSVPFEHATEDFVGSLSNAQKSDLVARIRYIKGKHAYLKRDYKKARKELEHCIRSGALALRLKSLIIYLLSLRGILNRPAHKRMSL